MKKDYAKIRFKIDPTTAPACVDLLTTDGAQKDAVIEGIYELKDKQLKLCVRLQGKDRPTEFASPDGSSIVLLKLHRD